MTDDSFDLLSGMDGPRPLSPDLRSRLQQQLLTADLEDGARPLSTELDARLTARMTDPVAALLAGLDAPRPLSPRLREQLTASLARRRRAPWLAGAAAAVLVVAGLAVAGSHGSPHPSSAGRAARPAATATPDALTGGVGASTTGSSTGGVAAPRRPVPAPTPPMAVGAQEGAGPAYDTVGGLRVAPGSGPAAGGTPIRLSGPDVQQATQVLVGDRPGDHLVLHSDGTVTVRTPPGTSGAVVDVTAVLRDGRRLVAHAAFRYV